jgi:hypothetical protein
MNYRCPHCTRMLNVPKLFFTDISVCKECGQRVALGDFFAFAMAAFGLIVGALTAMFRLMQTIDDPFVAGGYSIAIGMGVALVVLFLLGKAKPYKTTSYTAPAPLAKQPS